jgi:hypothetical protein
VNEGEERLFDRPFLTCAADHQPRTLSGVFFDRSEKSGLPSGSEGTMDGTSLPVWRGFGRILAVSCALGLGAIACQSSDESGRQNSKPDDAASSSSARLDAAPAPDGSGSGKKIDAALAADAGRVDPADTNKATSADTRISVPTDSGVDAPAIVEAGPVVEPSKADAGRSDGPPSSDGGRVADGSSVAMDGSSTTADSRPDLSPACQSLLVDNSGRPNEYPVIYREAAKAQQTFEAEKARLQSTFALTETDYTISSKPITWAGRIQKYGAGQIPVTGPIDTTTISTLAAGLISDWAVLFGAKGVTTTASTISCFNKFCQVLLSQDYCGMAVKSDQLDYTGNTPVSLYFTPIQAVSDIDSHFVPMIPMPRNVLLTDTDVKKAVVGQVYTYSCSTGQRTATVTSQDEVTVLGTRTVYVRKSTVVDSALEYRLVVPALVEIKGLPWTTYVDGIDGTVVASVSHFSCD